MSAATATAQGGVGDLVRLASSEDLSTVLECPVCTEIFLAPIYQCSKGHPICSACRPKLKECVQCRANYTDSRNYPLEAIIQASTFFCTQRDKGCAISLPGSSIHQHFQECPFRPLKCPYGKFDRCKDSILEVKRISDHMLTVHKFFGPTILSRKNEFLLKFSCDYWETPLITTSWKGRIIKFDGQTFLSRSFSQQSIFYFGLVLIGEESIASNYHFRIDLRKNRDQQGSVSAKENMTQPYFQVVLPVGSIRNLNLTAFQDGTIHYAIIHKSRLSLFGRLATTPEIGTKFLWDIGYQIIKF